MEHGEANLENVKGTVYEHVLQLRDECSEQHLHADQHDDGNLCETRDKISVASARAKHNKPLTSALLLCFSAMSVLQLVRNRAAPQNRGNLRVSISSLP
jgi:hypothetical protein